MLSKKELVTRQQKKISKIREDLKEAMKVLTDYLKMVEE